MGVLVSEDLQDFQSLKETVRDFIQNEVEPVAMQIEK